MKKILLAFYISATCFFAQGQEDFWEIIPDPFDEPIYSMCSCADNMIIIGSPDYIYGTINWGETWDTLLIGGSYKLESNELNYIYAGAGNCFGRSKDLGTSWSYPAQGLGINVIAIDSYSGGLVYSNARHQGGSCYVLRSTSYGDSATWEETATFPDDVQFIKDIKIKNYDTIYFGEINFFDGGGVYASYNGGDNWELIGLTDDFVECIEINSKGDVFAGTVGGSLATGGLFVLRNGETEWQQLIEYTLVTDILITESDSIYVGCSNYLHEGGVRFSSDDGYTWQNISGIIGSSEIEDLALTSGGYLIAATNNESIIYKSKEPIVSGIDIPQIEKPELKVFPNPCKNILNIEISQQFKGNVSVVIYDTFGKIVAEFANCRPINGTIKINLQDFENGIYYPCLKSEKNTYTTKPFLFMN